MDELIKAVEQLNRLRHDHPDLAVRPSARVVEAVTNQLVVVIEAIEEAVTQQREQQASNVIGLVGLPGFVDLSATPGLVVAALPAGEGDSDEPGGNNPSETVNHASQDSDVVSDGDDDYDYDDYDEEPEDVPAADLIAEITGADVDDKVTIRAIEAVLPSVHEVLGMYEIQVVNGGTAVLTAPDNEGIGIGSQPVGTEVFRAPIAELVGAVVVLKIAGPVDPDNPVQSPAERVAALLELMTQDEDVPAEPVDLVRLGLDRLDQTELTSATVREQILPVALRSLASLLGEHAVQDVIDGDDASQKVALLVPAGDGELDRRALSMGMAQFDGILPFAGIGRVRAHILAR